MMAYKIVVTVFNAMFMTLILMMEKDSKAVSTICFFIIVLLAMDIGLIWN